MALIPKGFLLPVVRRLHHVARIGARNLQNPTLVDCYYTLRVDGAHQIFYCSPVKERTANPVWPYITTDNCLGPPPPAVTCKFVVDVRATAPFASPNLKTDEVIFSTAVDTTTLVWISEELSHLPTVPGNTLILELNDGVYMTPESAANLKHSDDSKDSSHRRIKSSFKKVQAIGVDELLANAARVIRVRGQLETLQADCLAVQEQITKAVKTAGQGPDMQRELRHRTRRVNRIKRMLQLEKVQLEAERAQVGALRRVLLPDSTRVHQHTTQLKKAKHTLKAHHTDRTLAALRSTLTLARRRLVTRRRKLVSQLMSVYPIKKVERPLSSSHTLYSIRNITLPATQLTSHNEESISTALGYIAHLVFLLSKYLEVPLRYRIVYCASRSHITNDVELVHKRGNEKRAADLVRPLYFQSKDERRFEIGCKLLGKNIRHLLGVLSARPRRKVKASNYMLANLNMLLELEVPL